MSDENFQKWSWGQWTLDLSRPQVMGIINITPDSFSDGGDFASLESAVAEGRRHLEEGADILDVGGESSRPGAAAVSEADELKRVIPLVKALVKITNAPISVDTYKAEVARQALDNGAAIINDIYAGRYEPEIMKVAAKYKVPLILMHMLGEPGTMQKEPRYHDVVAEVRAFLLDAADRALKAGVEKDMIVLDPGLGFGKTAAHNLSLLNHFEKVMPTEYKNLMGLSRKAFLGHITGYQTAKERDFATAIANAIAVYKGAQILRVHRTAPTLEAIKVVMATRRESV